MTTHASASAPRVAKLTRERDGRPLCFFALALGLAGTGCFSSPSGARETTSTGAVSSFGGVLPWPDQPLATSNGDGDDTTTAGPSTAGSVTTSPSTSATGTGTGVGTGTAPTSHRLLLTELHPDPDGKDGGPGTPEFVEFVNAGAAPTPLAAAVLTARSWPTQDATALGLKTLELLPGETLVIERYADIADVPDPPLRSTEHGYAIAFRTSDGLRNADGGVQLRLGSEPADVVQYGLPQAAPFDDPAQWSGSPAPVPGAGESLCRISMDRDGNNSEDWELCPPSPGTPPSLEEIGGESEGDGTGGSGSTTGATTWGTWGTWDTWDTWDTWATGSSTGA